MWQKEEPCGPSEAPGSRSGCSQKPRDQDPHAGPCKQQPEALGATGTLRHREPRIPRCVTWGSSKHCSQLQPPLHSGLPVPPMYLAHFWMDRSPGSQRPGSRRWRRPGSQRARSPWLGRGPPAARGAASRWTRRERHCSGRPLAPRAWGDRGGHPVKSPHRVGLSEGTEAPWALALSLWAMCTDPGVPGTQPASWRWKGGRLIRFHLGRVSRETVVPRALAGIQALCLFLH